MGIVVATQINTFGANCSVGAPPYPVPPGYLDYAFDWVRGASYPEAGLAFSTAGDAQWAENFYLIGRHCCIMQYTIDTINDEILSVKAILKGANTAAVGDSSCQAVSYFGNQSPSTSDEIKGTYSQYGGKLGEPVVVSASITGDVDMPLNPLHFSAGAGIIKAIGILNAGDVQGVRPLASETVSISSLGLEIATRPNPPLDVVRSINCDRSTVTLSWAAGTINQTGFSIYMSADGVNFTPIGAVGASTFSFETPVLDRQTPYWFYIVTTRADGSSRPSYIVYLDSFHDTVVTESTVDGITTLEWSTESPAGLSYAIRRSIDYGAHYEDIGEVSATGYSLAAVSVPCMISITPKSVSYGEFCPGVASIPVALPATDIASGGFTANWEEWVGAVGYRIDVATNISFVNLVSGFDNLDVGNVLSYSITGLAGGYNYYYRVRAY